MPTGEPSGITKNANDVQIVIHPDSSEENILIERRTWDELQRIKAMPIPMAQKKMLKTQLTTMPKFQLKGWSRIKYTWRRYKKNIRMKWNHFNRHMIFLNGSLQAIELHVGTAIGNVFLFIKWTIYLNIAISLCLFAFVIIPYLRYVSITGAKYNNTANASCSAMDEGHNMTLLLNNSALMTSFLDCCQAKYMSRLATDNKDEAKEADEGVVSGSFFSRALRTLGGGQNIKLWPIYISFYRDPYLSYDESGTKYAFSAAYVLCGLVILACCLILVVRNVAAGVREVIILKEGELYKYSNLIFSGWEFFTNDPIGAGFKVKMIRDEMKQILSTEKKKITDTGKSRREKLKIILVRTLVNIIVFGMLMGAGYTIFTLSLEFKKFDHLTSIEQNYTASKPTMLDNLKEFSVSFVISFFNLIFPLVLTKLGKLEDHSREVEIAMVLLRSLFIRIFSIYALAGVYYKHTYCKPEDGYCTKCDKRDDKDEILDFRLPCWEVMFAEQVYKLVLAELVIKVLLTFIIDPGRRYVGKCFKSKIAEKIGRLNFNVVRHSLDIIYIQLLAWISFYFAPMMPIVTAIYCYLIFYVKKFGVMYNVNYVPDTVRTTRTTAVFMAAKIISFVVILFTFAFIVGFMVPSRECGPFRGSPNAWSAVSEEFAQFPWIAMVLDPFFPGAAIPLSLVLMLLAYYYYSVALANRSMVETLRHLLILEGHDKQYLFTKLNKLRQTGLEKANPPKVPEIEKTIFKDPKLAKRLSITSTFDLSKPSNTGPSNKK